MQEAEGAVVQSSGLPMAELSHGGCGVRSLGKGKAAQPAAGGRVEVAGCVSPLQGESSEIT